MVGNSTEGWSWAGHRIILFSLIKHRQGAGRPVSQITLTRALTQTLQAGDVFEVCRSGGDRHSLNSPECFKGQGPGTAQGGRGGGCGMLEMSKLF